jgi:DNA-binding response OmpR family regulator
MDRILLVEDDIDLAAMICEYFVLEGFAVDAVHDGAASATSRPADYDLVVLDVMLPNRSGFEVLKALRQHSNIPVILLTARDGETDRVVGLELGADDYVPKPFKPRELVARIRAVLRRTHRPAHGAAAEPLERGAAQPGCPLRHAQRPQARPDQRGVRLAADLPAMRWNAGQPRCLGSGCPRAGERVWDGAQRGHAG